MKRTIEFVMVFFMCILIFAFGCSRNTSASDTTNDTTTPDTTNGANSQKIPVESIVIYYNNNLFDYTKYYYELKTNEMVQFTAKILPVDATIQTLTWSSDSSVAVVYQSGLIRGVHVGTANITVKADKVSITIVVKVVTNEIPLTLSNYNNYLTMSCSATTVSANLYITPKYGYTIKSLDMYVTIPTTLTYSRSGQRDISISVPIYTSVTTNGYSSYSLYNIIMQNQPNQYVIKSVSCDNPIITKISGNVVSII